MLFNPLRMILIRLESDPPIITGDEMCSRLGSALAALEARGLLRPDRPVQELPCIDCGSGHICQVTFVKDETTGQQVASICCPECGVVFIDSLRLRRWRIDISAFLQEISMKAGVTFCLSEVVPGLIWRLGKANWAGHSREVFFVRRCRSNEEAKIAAELSHRKKSMLLTTIDTTARMLRKLLPNPIFALETLITFGDHSLRVDYDFLETRLREVGADEKSAQKAPPKRRSSRTADMDVLKRELIEHIKAARDHAITTRDRTGDAKLLPRPSKEELGRRVGLRKYSVTRCFNDPQAFDLVQLWELAENLERIIGYRN